MFPSFRHSVTLGTYMLLRLTNMVLPTKPKPAKDPWTLPTPHTPGPPGRPWPTWPPRPTEPSEPPDPLSEFHCVYSNRGPTMSSSFSTPEGLERYPRSGYFLVITKDKLGYSLHNGLKWFERGLTKVDVTWYWSCMMLHIKKRILNKKIAYVFKIYYEVIKESHILRW